MSRKKKHQALAREYCTTTVVVELKLLDGRPTTPMLKQGAARKMQQTQYLLVGMQLFFLGSKYMLSERPPRSSGSTRCLDRLHVKVFCQVAISSRRTTSCWPILCPNEPKVQRAAHDILGFGYPLDQRSKGTWSVQRLQPRKNERRIPMKRGWGSRSPN